MPNVKHSPPNESADKMTTRSRSAARAAESETDVIELRSQEVQIQLMADIEKLHLERERFEQESAEARREIEREKAFLQDKEDNARGRDVIIETRDETIDRLLRQVSNLENQLRRNREPTPATDIVTDHRLIPPSSRARRPSVDDQEDLAPPRLSFREVLDTIPTFNGYNMPVTQFARACRRARDLFPVQSERNLTRMICNKLRDRAAAAVEDEPCSTITQLVDLLNGAFGSFKTLDQYRGELSMVFLKPQEHILDYISRVKDLRSAIIDSMRREHLDTPNGLAEVDKLTVRSFTDGLPLPYRLQMQLDKVDNLASAFSTAKAIARRQEFNSSRYDRAPRSPPPRSYDRQPPREQPPSRSAAISNPWHRDRPGYRPEPSRRPLKSQRDWRDRAPPRDERNINRPTNAPPPVQPRRDAKWCRYCKISGHEIDECRKRQYNNARSGNGQSSPRNAGEPREEYSRPPRQINVMTENPEPASPEPSTSQC